MRRAIVFAIALFAITWTSSTYWPTPEQPDSLWAILAPLIVVVWTPTVLALLFVAHEGGVSGIREELRTRLRFNIDATRWYVAAAVAPAIIVALAIGLARLAGHGAPFLATEFIPRAIGIQLITGAVGEEIGWRGYLVSRLATGIGAVWASFAMATLWVLWHLPAFLTPGTPYHSWPLWSSLLTVWLLGAFMGLVFERTGGSVLATILAHLAFNIMTAMEGVNLASSTFWRTTSICFALIVVWMLKTRSPQTP
jgi:membrane protease YdiL (CAAX protease family)